MKTIQQDTYLFSELGERAKQSVIERESKFISEDWDYLDGDFYIDTAKEDLEENGWEDVEIAYSGFSSQGDGFSFTGNVSDLHKVLLWAGESEESIVKNWSVAVREHKEGELVLSMYRDNGGRYVHENSVRLDVEYSGDTIVIEEILEELKNIIEEKKTSFCKETYKTMGTAYYTSMSDENITERLLEQDGEEGERYLENGTLA